MKRYSPYQLSVTTTTMRGGIAVFGGQVNGQSNTGVSSLFE
ncbi:MAG TPA: hypothetical protein VG992_00795 [Candidatus Saccharimonadales bacterium]|nr:hypothetical protein [Candidatus Saccharimonadales bacterium]